jgi:hypothetical protein
MEFGEIQNGISYKKIILGFLFFSLAFIGLIFHFTFSQAEIVLYPKEIKKTVSFKVKIDKNIKTPNAARNILSGTILEIAKTGSKTFKTESITQVDDFAKGEITIYNKREKDQPLYQKSQIAPFGKKFPVFLIDKRILIPAQSEIKVGITAQKEGADGNIEPTKFDFLKLSSWMRERIWAESFVATKGGTKDVGIVAEKDIKNAEKNLAEELWQKSFEEIEKKLKNNEQIIPQAVKNEIIKTKCDTKPDTIKENFLVETETKTQCVGVSEKILLSLAKMRLKKEGAADEEFKKCMEETFNYKLTEINIEDGWARLEVNLDGIFTPKFSAKVFEKEKIIGMSEEEVKKYFKDFETIEKVEVNFWPLWVKNIPGLKKNIRIEINPVK